MIALMWLPTMCTKPAKGGCDTLLEHGTYYFKMH